MADLGARVIWVERPGSRTRWHIDDDPASVDGADLYHLEMSRNKESIVLDLTSAEGLAAARKLIANSDILIENNRPGAMSKLGLGAEAVCTEFPHLVYVSLSGYGSFGPWSERRSYGPAIEAASGIEGRTGYPGDEPLRLGHPLPDATGGLVGALAALRGLRERDERGYGGWYDVSQLEAYIAMSGEDYILGTELPRIGNLSRWGARQGVFPCAGTDNWIAIRLVDKADERAFCVAMGIDFSDQAALAALTSASEKYALAASLQAAGIEAFPVLNCDELPNDPHLTARNFFVDMEIGAGRVARFPGSPLRPLADPRGPSPNFGDQSADLRKTISNLIIKGN
jgi:formyl-CoA transferase